MRWRLLYLGLLLVASAPAYPQEMPGRAMIYLFWNEDYFYLAAQVDDENVTGRSQGLMQPVWDDDAVALYFDVSRARAAHLTPTCYLVAASAAGGVTVLRGEAGAWVQHRALGQFKFEVKVQGTLNRPGDLDSGYTMEMGIPWSCLGGRPRDGATIGFNLVVFQRGETDQFVSAAPAIQDENDLSNPSKWTDLTFQRDLTLRAEMQAILCPRWEQIPLVDGTLKPAEWPLTSVFLLAYTPALRRTAQPAGTYPAPGEPLMVPLIEPEPAPPSPTIPPSPYQGERYIIAPYWFDYQGDERAPWPARKVRYPDGSLQLSEKPMEGVGPWFSTLRVAWHRQQLQHARDAGIDFLLPCYSPDTRSRQEWAKPGLQALVTALKELRRSNLADPATDRDYPLLGLALSLDSLASEVSPLDLTQPAGQEGLWRAIREYFWQVPPDLWAVVTLPDRQVVPVYLTEPRRAQDLDPTLLDYCQQRFRATFGVGILWLGHPGWSQRGVRQMDGYAALVGGLRAGRWDQGSLRIGVVGPGYNNLRAPGEGLQLRPRNGTLTMKQDAAEVVAGQPDWLIIDSWNDFVHGTQVAPSREHGLQYLDVSSLIAFQFSGARERDAKFLSHNVPARLAPGQEYQVELRIANAGFSHWREEQGIALVPRWAREGQMVAQGVPWLLQELKRGASRTYVIPLRTVKDDGTPLEAGPYELHFGLQAGNERWFSQEGDRDLVVPVEIGTLPPYQASLLTSLTPTYLVSGEQRPIRVLVRNDGAQPWEGVRLRYVWERAEAALTGAEQRIEVAVGESVEFPPTPIGQVNSALVALMAKDAHGTPLPPLADPHQHYLLRWELLTPEGQPMPLTRPWQEEVELLQEHPGVIFLRGAFPPAFQAGQHGQVVVRLFNNSTTAWAADDVSLGYHWYYWDGVEAVWDDQQRMRLPEEVAAGQGVNLVLPVRAPQGAGPYVLMIDALWRGERWVSHLPSTNSRDVLIEYVQVENDRFLPLNLERHVNLDGVSTEADRSDGDFDGRGGTFPSEEMPPDVPKSGGGLYPSGYWGRRSTDPAGDQDRVPFLYPPKGAREKNFIACSRQSIAVPRAHYRRLHILAAAAPDPVEVVWTLRYWPRDRQTVRLNVSHWNGPPAPEDRIGFVTLHIHTPKAESTERRGYLYHYVLPIDPQRYLEDILLPKDPRLKVLAMTLEK